MPATTLLRHFPWAVNPVNIPSIPGPGGLLAHAGLSVQKDIPLPWAEMPIPDGHLYTGRTGQLLLLSFAIFFS